MASKFWFRTSLTGGGVGALDGIDGNKLGEGDAAMVVTSSSFYMYYCDINSAVNESSPDYIVPDDNANGKYWKLLPIVEP